MSIALVSPWIKYFGSFAASRPTRYLRRLQSFESSELVRLQLDSFIKLEKLKAQLEEAKAKTEAERENRPIEAAKRLEDADRIYDGSTVEEIKAQRTIENSNLPKVSNEKLRGFLRKNELKILELMGKFEDKIKSRYLDERAISYFSGNLSDNISRLTPVRLEAELSSAVDKFSELHLAEKDSQASWSLTKRGYELVDYIKGQSPPQVILPRLFNNDLHNITDTHPINAFINKQISVDLWCIRPCPARRDAVFVDIVHDDLKRPANLRGQLCR
jgi:hypothetical protein